MNTKRILATVIVTVGTLVATTTAASAQTSYPPSPSAPSSVLGGGGETNAASAGTAFTGSDIAVAALVAVALLVVGSVGLYLARRRAD